jgi:hypothetical protein
MGTLCDYFRAASDAAAVNLMDELGGGPVAAGDGAAIDAIDLKGIEPAVTLGRLVALVRGVSWDVNVVNTELLWSGAEEGPWLMSIDDAVRDTLASIASSAQLMELSAQWGRTEELAWNGPLPDDEMLPVIDQIAGLARRARDAGDHMYCWCSL